MALDLPLEGPAQVDPGKWWKVCHPRLMSFGSLAMLASLFVSIVILEHHTEVGARLKMASFVKAPGPNQVSSPASPSHGSSPTSCEAQNHEHKKQGIDSLPNGIIQETSDLQFRSLWADPTIEAQQPVSSLSLLAMPVGIRQKDTVDQIIKKFPAENFTVMLFHYDGVVDEWNEFPWSKGAIHIAASNQTKWWFAKRFLHPDVIAPYKYIFVWDEDIGVENFHAVRYLTIVEEEGLEISQPALDPGVSEVHHQITVRKRGVRAHRRTYKYKGSGLCFENSTQPPCTGWVEMMVPVFTRAAWRCSWYMIQNDLIHAWGLDMKLGYCAQGDRSVKVGVVDEQYVVHHGIPSLGGLTNKMKSTNSKEATGMKTIAPATSKKESKASHENDYQDRGAVRRRSYVELEIFRKRWKVASQKDKCWNDPY